MAERGRGKINYQRREFRSTNRRNNTHRSTDLPSTSRNQHWDEWPEEESDLKQPFSDMKPDFMQHKAWLEELLVAWSKSNDFYITSQLLKVSFKSSSNPYRTALYFMIESPDFKTGKPNTLSSTVMKAFQEWLKENNNSIEKYPNLFEIQTDAFQEAGNQSNSNLTQMVVEIYKLADVGEKFLDGVKRLVKTGDYKQACLFASLLNIQKFFNIDEFLVPLLLQDRVNFVQNYLDKWPQHRIPFVQFIDSMCTYEKNAFQLVTALNIQDAKAAKWNPRAFKKLGSRLIKLYNIPANVCPNISQINNTGTLKYLLHKKYTEENISDEAWEEMIETVVKEDVGLQIELCTLLVCYNDLHCAVKCALKYKVPTEQLPDALQAALEGKESYATLEDENWDDVIDAEPEMVHLFHSLSLPESAIILVDNRQQFDAMLDVLQVSDVIGCDCEWKPGAGTKLSIIQIATWDQIFIIDVKVILDNFQSDEIESDSKIDAKDWRGLILAVFANPDIKKLGFGFSTDLKMLSQSLPECETLHSETKNLLDLHVLCQKLAVIHPEIFPYHTTNTSRGLTDIVLMCLGRKLDKREQFSNWDNRPLRKRQIEYAAMDSFCLLEVYNVLQCRAAEFGVNLELLMINPQGKKSKRKSSNPQLENLPHCSGLNAPPPCSPGDFKVVVDSMLQGLGRQLRLVGVDVKMVENADQHQTALQIGLNENRVILTSGTPYKKISQYAEPGMCFYVNIALPQREQAERVLNHYNVQVTTQDIFSRCPKCNNCRYIKAPSETMKALWENSLILSKPSPFRTAIWKTFEGGKIDTLNIMTDEDAVLQFDGVNDELFSRVNLFYVCSKCGKVYWEGSHLKRVVSNLKNLVID